MSKRLAEARTGRREFNKEDKLRRIKDAARKLFIANGFDETSTRQIAVNADVALGTLFLYAANKRDLLFLVANEDLENVADRAAAAVRSDASLIDNLVAVFRPLYEFFGEEPELSRLTLREMTFYEFGPQAKRFLATRHRMIDLCRDIVRLAQSKNEIKTDRRYRKAGEVLFAIYQIEIRKWLMAPRLDIEEGLQNLREDLEIVITGLSKRPQP